MGGQGSPNFHRCPYVTTQRRASARAGKRCAPFLLPAAVIFALFISLPFTQPNHCSAQTDQDENNANVTLRFAWGGGIPQKWQGSISIEKGSFLDSRPLAITADAPSTVVERGNKLVISHRISTSYGGADVTIDGDKETSIKLSLTTDSGKSIQRSWKLDALLAGINEAIEQQNKISISRAPGDEISLEINRPHLVFDPGDTWQFECGLQRSALKSDVVTTRFFWAADGNINQRKPISDTTVSLSANTDGSSEQEPVQITLPKTEGAHTLLIECESQPKPSFGQFRRPQKVTRCVQVVVVSPDSPPNDNTPWKSFQTWTPQQLHGGFRSSWPRLPGSKEPTRNGKLSLASIDNKSNSAIKLEPAASISLPVTHPDGSDAEGPIRVSIRYRSKPGTRLGINYLSSTQQILHGMDSGVAVAQSPSGIEPDEQWRVHQFHLWPEPTAGAIRISNDDAAISALIGEIKFESGPVRLSASPTAAQPVDADGTARRQRMAFLQSPDFIGLFQAQRIADPQTGQALDDWNTFFDFANRFTQHLKANSYDGAFVTIAADGSAIFPSAGLASGPRFDSGVFSSDACDPLQKDVVELLLRLFDREGLTFVPVLTLNSTIGNLEAFRQTDLMSFDLVGEEGQRTNFNRRLLPVYNPLDLTLQGLCTRSINRITDRYGKHRSYAGLALACRPDCCTLLPDAKQGRDNVTTQRFLDRENNDTEGFDDDAWLTWRSQQMAAWYSDIQQQTGQDLYLLPIDIDRRPEFIRAMKPSLQHGGDYAAAMKEIGLDLGASPHQGVMVLAPIQIAPGFSLAQKRVDLNTRQSLAAGQFIEQHSSGSIFSHRGHWRSGTDSMTQLRLYTPSGNSNRRRYIESIRKHDCRLFVESGASLPRVSDRETEAMLRVIRELPATRFDDIGDPKTGPVCMRQLSIDGKHYFYAVNDSPWPVKVSAWLSQKNLPKVLQASNRGTSRAAPLKTLDGKEVLLKREPASTSIEIFLEPWSIYAGVAETNSAFNPYAIEGFQITLPKGSDSQLRKKLHQLKSKLAKAQLAPPLSSLLNGSFESFSDPDRSGWEFGTHEEAKFELDSDDQQHRKMSLSMQTSGRPVWIRSNQISLPTTGRLSVSVWLKTNDAADPPARIAIEGTSDKADFYRHVPIVTEANGQSPLDGTWRKFVAHFDDLPDDLSDLKIGFDLLGPGQLSIDEVEIFDRWFDENDSVAMTQLLASAGSRLNNEAAIDSSRRVLENYWVQFLDQHIGREEESNPEAPDRQARQGLEFGLPEMPAFELPQIRPPTAPKLPLFQRLQK